MEKEWSIKVPLNDSEFKELLSIKESMKLNMKIIVNKSIEMAYNDFINNHYIKRTGSLYCDKTTMHSFMVYDKNYKDLAEMSKLVGINKKELLRIIISAYPIIFKDRMKDIF